MGISFLYSLGLYVVLSAICLIPLNTRFVGQSIGTGDVNYKTKNSQELLKVKG